MRQAGGNRNPWLTNDPNWDYNNAGDRANCQTAIRNLVEAVSVCGELGVNWTKLQNVGRGQMNTLVTIGDNHGELY